METIVLEFKRRGAIKELFAMEREGRFPSELLIEGPAGTGKSRGWGEFLYKLTQKYPGTRGAILRKTRVSLTESFLVTWEGDVLLPDDPAREGPTRAHRSTYTWPNGTEVWIGGLDNPTRLYSAQFDWIYVQEATELTLDEWERLARALRNHKMPFQFIGGDCNPDAPTHWLNQRCIQGKTARLVSRHKDNPSIRPEYVARLSNLTGVRRRRLFLGEWCAAEGMVWETYDAATNIIDEPEWRTSLGIVEYRASFDWGSTHPGVLGIWGLDSRKRATLVATWQRTGMTPQWWAERLCDAMREFQIQRAVGDPSRPEMIRLMNDCLGQRGYSRIVYPANNKKASTGAGDMGGLALVKWGFTKDETGTPRIRFLRNALRGGPDPELLEGFKPTWVCEEIPSYVHARDASGEFMFETTDKDCADDGCDMTRYMATDNWGLTPQAPPPPPDPAPRSWTNEWQFGTPKSLELARLKRENGDDD